MPEINGELAEIEPPVYSEQGQPRGRKPKNAKKGKGKNKKGKGKSKKGTMDKRKRENKGHGKRLKKIVKAAKVARAAKDSESLEPVEKGKGGSRVPSAASNGPRRRAPSSSPQDDSFTVPEDCVAPPEGIPSNLIYSKAYVIRKKQGGNTDDCRLAGQHASWLLREKNLVSPSLSGPATYKPKPRKAKDTIPETEESKEPEAPDTSAKPCKPFKKKKISKDTNKKAKINAEGEGGDSGSMAIEP
eukprot:s2032_g9.t1